MKIRNFVVVSLLALVFVLSPVFTNAQTTCDLNLLICRLNNQISEIKIQEFQQQINALLQQIAALNQPCKQPGAIYDFLTGKTCAGNISNRPPSISGVRGPVMLKTGEGGTWTVTASDPENGVLNYSVIWGDEMNTSGSGVIQQKAIFSHTYSTPGTYSPTFTVTDDKGQSAKTSLSVVVGGGTITPPIPIPTITVVSPNGGESFQVGSTYTIKWTATNFGKNVGYIMARPNPTGRAIIIYSGGSGISYNDNSGSGQYNWSVPSSVPAGQYKLVVGGADSDGNNDVYDLSDNYFTITSGVVQPTPVLISSAPPNNSVDAHQPNNLIGNPIGISGITMTFGNSNGASMSNSDFSIAVSSGPQPTITNNVGIINRFGDQTTYSMIFSRPIVPGERWTVTHKPTNSSICYGYLPGDVDQNGWALNSDIGILNGWVGTAEGNAKPLYQTDINRDGVFNAADVTRAGELMSAPNRVFRLAACPAPMAQITNQTQTANTLFSLMNLLQSLQQSLGR